MEKTAVAGPESVVSLREVTTETVRTVCRLSVAESQQKMVAPVALSIARAYFEPKLWFRAICASETPVGFLMMYADPERSFYVLWSLLIDARYQRNGFGKRALGLLEQYIRTQLGGSVLQTSYYQVEGGPEPFYRKLGFVPTGMDGDEVVAEKRL